MNFEEIIMNDVRLRGVQIIQEMGSEVACDLGMFPGPQRRQVGHPAILNPLYQDPPEGILA